MHDFSIQEWFYLFSIIALLLAGGFTLFRWRMGEVFVTREEAKADRDAAAQVSQERWDRHFEQHREVVKRLDEKMDSLAEGQAEIVQDIREVRRLVNGGK